VADAINRYLGASCGNSHTESSATGRDTTRMINQAHRDLAALVGSHDEDDTVIFMGSGTTAAMCFVADSIKAVCESQRTRGDTGKQFVVVSALEHHSNLLPWMRRFVPLYARANLDGTIDMQFLSDLLKTYHGKVAAVTVTGVSNVTGVMPPLAEIADMAHQAGALFVVDAAQAAAHIPLHKQHMKIDVIVGSGHKMYAPGSPGWLVANRSLFSTLGWNVGPTGGGTVDRVELESVRLKDDPTERYEAGTPNIPGIIGLGAASYLLHSIGMEKVLEHEQKLIAYCLEKMQSVGDRLVTYGPLDPSKKTAVVSFNLGEIPHSAVAVILNDFFAIQVRNGCFCAQPYTRQQIAAACDARGFCEPVFAGKTGMVRASFGIYSSERDVDRLVDALKWIVTNREALRAVMHDNDDGTWQHNWFRSSTGYDYRAVVDSAG
jgi:cysteine desulfurase/selenocysteine lyase